MVSRYNAIEAKRAAENDGEMLIPFGTLGQGYNKVGVVADLPSFVHLKPAQHPGAGRESQTIRGDVDLEVYNDVKSDAGLLGGSALLAQRPGKPQFMCIGSSVTEKKLPHVAGGGEATQKAAICNRHFKESTNDYGGVTGVVQEHARPSIEAVVDAIVRVLKDAGRTAQEFQQFPLDYDANAKDAAESLHKKTTLLADFEWFAYIPGSWGNPFGQRGQTGFSKLAACKEGVKQVHTFFVKLNEALQKIKPRLIQSMGDNGCMTYTFDAAFLETLMFGISLLEKRSVKHAGPEHLRARLANLLRPFLKGYGISYDYGSFDGSNCQRGNDPRKALKELVEIRVLHMLFGADAQLSDISRQAAEERARKFLRSSSVYWTLYTKVFGRESGDRGTSCLNFLVNLTLWLTMMALETAYRKNRAKWPNVGKKESGEGSAEASVPAMDAFAMSMEFDTAEVERWLKGESTGFDWLGEGDDGLWLFTEKFADASPGGRHTMADRFHYWSCMQGTNLEAQDETGQCFGERRLQPVTRRIEHCSRIIVHYFVEKKGKAGKSLRVALLPKMRKTIEAADITFGLEGGDKMDESTKTSIAFTKYASCAFNCIDDPLMFGYMMMHAKVLLFKGKRVNLENATPKCAETSFKYDSKNFVHKTMANAMSGPTKLINEDEMTELPFGPVRLLQMLQQRHVSHTSHDGHVEAMIKAVQLESPLIDRDFYLSIVDAMSDATTWETCGELASQVKARLGAV